MAPMLWPIGILKPQSVTFEIAARTLAGPSSVSGVTQVVASDAGIWKATFTNVILNTRNREQVLVFRALAALLEGRMNPVLVPLCRAYQPYAPEWQGFYEPVPHSDDSPFSDGSEYQGTVIGVTLASNIPVRGPTANVTITLAHEIQPGQHFSIGGRLYRIRTVTPTGPNSATITFRPPAREAATIGTELEFDNPVCRMRLASDGELDLQLARGTWTYPTVNFIEDV